MRRSVLILALAATLFCGCEMLNTGKESYTADRLVIVENYADKAPANLVILPVETEESLDFQGKQMLREFTYAWLMEKGYAPLALTFTDRTLRDQGRFHTPLQLEGEWNLEPFKGMLSAYSDAVLLLTIDRYLESGQPGQSGIVIWGRVGIFDAESMELLYEHFTRQTLHPTDPGGGRERYIHKALQEFVELIMGGLPPRSD